MSQARTLTQKELKQLMSFNALKRHGLRDRTMLLFTHWCGARVGEVAALRYCDVVGADAQILAEVRLAPEQTKGKHARTIFLPEKLRKELATYVAAFPPKQPTQPLFYTQKRAGWSANTLAQHFLHIYRAAGLHGASSHTGRRTFITSLASKGVGVRVLMSLAGHRNISSTQFYIDINDTMKRAAVELI